ncbi:hypothetical protein P7C73_g5756, partial [Tremellales sp. Uapishka_1]
MEQDDEETKALPEWVKLEYSHMLTLVAPSQVHFTSLSASSIPPLKAHFASSSSSNANLHTLPILDLIASLDPPVPQSRVCLLDPKAPLPLSPEDGEKFTWFLYGGILGDDPPRDRTSELRKLGFETRHLLSMQMTTDTAVGVSKIVVEDQIPLDEIPFVDHPTITFNKHESIEMPFRYVATKEGEPILPPGMNKHLKADLDRTIDDF